MWVSSKYFASNDLNLKLETSSSILLDEKYFWISFHDDMTLLIKAFLPYFLVLLILNFKNFFKQQDVSYLCESEEKENQWLKIDGRSNLIDLLIKRQFSIMILLCNLTILCI